MNKLVTGVFAIGLLFSAASCGSDAKTTTTTPITAVATDASVAGDGAATDAGTNDVPAAAVALGVADAAAAGVTLDEACYAAVVAKLSDADAQIIVDAGPGAKVTLSAEGEAHSAEAAACASVATATT